MANGLRALLMCRLEISRLPIFQGKKGHTQVMVEFTHNMDIENMYIQYESNQKSVRTYQAYKQVTLT